MQAKYCQNMPKARELWGIIMQSGFGSQASIWLEYARLERYVNVKHCYGCVHNNTGLQDMILLASQTGFIYIRVANLVHYTMGADEGGQMTL